MNELMVAIANLCRKINWNLVQTFLEVVIPGLVWFGHKQYRKFALRNVLSLRLSRKECDVSIATHRCVVLNRKRDMIVQKEAEPLFQLIAQLNSAGIKANVMEADKSASFDEIHIGGPVSNRNTNRYFCRYIKNIKWLATSSHVEEYKNDENLRTFNYDYLRINDEVEGFEINGEVYKYVKDKEGWALIIRMNVSDDADPKTVHLLFGCGTNGTIGAVRYFIKNYHRIMMHNFGKKDYIGIFKVDKDGNKVGKVKWLQAGEHIDEESHYGKNGSAAQMNEKESPLTNREYEKLIKRLEFFDTMRNNLLSFSFTAVLAALGAMLILKNNLISALLCLVPFCLIVPFTARIAYYRLASAHINSFLKVYAKDKMKFEIGTKRVPERMCKHFGLIAWLVNHEMFVLGVACCITFYIKYISAIRIWTWWSAVLLIIPVIPMIMIFLLSDATYDYAELTTSFQREWEKQNI